jgi:cell division septation protein DedD
MVLTELTNKHPKLLSKQLSTITQPEDKSAKPALYRIQLGAFSAQNDASKLCQKLADNQQNCFVVKVTAQQ